MPESVCEEPLDELFDDPLLSFADYLSLRRQKCITKGFDYDVLAHRFSLTVLTHVRKPFEKVAQF